MKRLLVVGLTVTAVVIAAVYGTTTARTQPTGSKTVDGVTYTARSSYRFLYGDSPEISRPFRTDR